MAELTKAQFIWDRACSDGLNYLLPGDRALAAILVFHGAVMNGGVLHAFDCISQSEAAAAELGYRYFGLDDVADLIKDVKTGPKDNCDLDTWEVELNNRYSLFVSDDSGVGSAV